MAEYYFIVNIQSRTGKAERIWQEVQEELRLQKVDYEAFVTEYKGHATELATMLIARKEPVTHLVVVGGDGTSNEVLNGISDFSRVEIGFIPTGSGNDLGRGLGLKGDAIAHLNRILHPTQIARIDLGSVSWNQGEERRIFAISSGIGLDADVCKQALTTKLKNVLNAIGLGSLTYVLLTIKTLFAMETTSASIVLDTGEAFSRERMICTVAMNFRCEGGGVPMAPQASATDGRLSFCCISGIPKWRTFLCLPFLVLAKHEKLKGFELINCKSMDITIQKKMIVHADGEYCGDRDVLHFSCLPGVLKVRM